MKHDNMTLRPDLGTLKTEGRNQNTLHIDKMTTLEMVTVMNNENRVVEDAIATQLQERSEERRVGKECRSRWSAYH